MASPNTSYTDLITTTLEFLGDEVADDVSLGSPLTAYLKAHDGWTTIEGGTKILEPLAYAENSNAQWYSGGERLNINPQEEFSAAEYAWKQLAVSIVNTGLETDVQNVGSRRRFDLAKERIKNARRTMRNRVAVGVMSDGTGSGGKQIGGLQLLISKTPTTGTVGGINRATATNAFWRNKFTDTGATPTTDFLTRLNTMWYSLERDGDKPKVLVADSVCTGAYEAALQTNQRFTDPKMADLGFEALKYKSGIWVYDPNCTASTTYFVNTDFLKVRVAEGRNFKALPKRSPVDQDAEIVLLAAALNMSMSNAALQGGIEFAA
jgi:hypothetical protein